jgi:ribosomal protein L28
MTGVLGLRNGTNMIACCPLSFIPATPHMANNQCPICKKGIINGGGYSNRVRATKFNPTGMRLRYPNLQWATLPTGGRIKICTGCIKASKHLTVKLKPKRKVAHVSPKKTTLKAKKK